MLHYGYNSTCPQNSYRWTLWVYSVGARHIHNLRDSHITALTLEGSGGILVARSTEVDIIENCIMDNTTWPQNIAGYVQYGYKVSEPGTYLSRHPRTKGELMVDRSTEVETI